MDNENNTRIPAFCSVCGNPISENHAFCQVCGFDLRYNMPREELRSENTESRGSTEEASAEQDGRFIKEQPVLNTEGAQEPLYPSDYQPVYYAAYPPAEPSAPEKKKKTHPLSVTAFVLSLVSIIPILNFITILPATVLSVIGLVKSKGRKIGMAISALVISVVILTLIVAAVILFAAVEIDMNNNPRLLDFDYLAEEPWMSISEDYIIIDTNPYDVTNQNDEDALWEISNINDALGFSEDLYSRMIATSFLEGTQTEASENGKFTVSWWYHPDYGLEVTYTENNNVM